MMTINVNTKIGNILKAHGDALEAIISISPKFTKLRNPILQKVIAARTSIALASRIAGCSVDDFYKKLQPLGFEIDKTKAVIEEENEKKSIPEFMKNIGVDKIVELDVRPLIESGNDPLKIILQKVNALETGSVLKIINTFEPTPLMLLLGKQGFESCTETIGDELVHTYFCKNSNKSFIPEPNQTDYSKGWDEIIFRFKDKLETVDVRELQMPLPMHTILEALETLPNDKALFVYHKRIPVYLLPELDELQFSHRIKEINDAEVHLLIYKN